MIDANQQRCWLLADGRRFALEAAPARHARWDPERRVLRFASFRAARDLPAEVTSPDLPAARERARHLADQAPVTLDAFGTWAATVDTGRTIIAGGVSDPPIPLVTLPGGDRVVDMAMGCDGVLFVVSRGAGDERAVYLINRLASREDLDAGREAAIRKLPPPAGGNPDRIVALAEGGALALERAAGHFWQIVGRPRRGRPKAAYSPPTPRPCQPVPDAYRMIDRPDLQLPADREIIAMASGGPDRVALLVWPHQGPAPAEAFLATASGVRGPFRLQGAVAPYAIGWVEGDRWALVFEDHLQAVAYDIAGTPAGPALEPVGHRYPLHRERAAGANAVFCNSPIQPVHYPQRDARGRLRPKPLHRLSYAAYPSRAQVECRSVIDSGRHGTTWHRLYLEAHLPPGTGVRVMLAADNDLQSLQANPAWMPHSFGALPAEPDIPRGAWVRDASEVPYHPGLLYCAPCRHRAGLFTALVQRPGRRVRSLAGRYLRLRVDLVGNGHASPEVAALRIYGPRFSYRDAYLPDLYGETLLGPDADQQGAATGADFVERLLGLFESVLTPLEDKIASAYMLTNPLSAPEEALAWLARWVAVDLEAEMPVACKRGLIRQATRLYRRRGTLQGLALALDLATDKAVRRRRIVLLEDFRLRRTFATLLGADLSVEDDALMMGPIPNANSYVGDTLILGDDANKEFLALYADDLAAAEASETVVATLYARLAQRLTVLVHDHADEEELDLIRRVVALQTPAHTDFRIVAASRPLLVGLYALVGWDTYLRTEPPRGQARIGESFIGRQDVIRKLPVLDDRLEP